MWQELQENTQSNSVEKTSSSSKFLREFRCKEFVRLPNGQALCLKSSGCRSERFTQSSKVKANGDTAREDSVGDKIFGYNNLDSNGRTRAVEMNTSRDATLALAMTATDISRRFDSSISLAPSVQNPQVPDLQENFGISLSTIASQSWKLVRLLHVSNTQSPPLLTEEGTFPNSGNMNGSLSVGAFDTSIIRKEQPVGVSLHILSLELLNPPDGFRNIEFYIRHREDANWSPFPFP
jgi:hypothetical protein